VFAFRRAHPVLQRGTFYTDEEIYWFNPSGKIPDWFDPGQKCLACLIRSQNVADLFLMFNAENEAVTFVVPSARSPRFWRLAADTAERSPLGFYSPGEEAALANPATYLVQSRSSVILVAR
jgi:pullulanase/glycogen debranching enzyme